MTPATTAAVRSGLDVFSGRRRDATSEARATHGPITVKRWSIWPLVGLMLALALLAWGCDAQGEQDTFAHQAQRTPDGITRVDVDGEQVSADPDDWRTSPYYRGRIRVDPAFPNPVSVHQVHLPLTVIGFEAVQGGALTLRTYGPNRRDLIRLGEVVPIDGPGSYVFRFSPGELGSKGIHRVFIFDLAGEIVSYGDILVE